MACLLLGTLNLWLASEDTSLSFVWISLSSSTSTTFFYFAFALSSSSCCYLMNSRAFAFCSLVLPPLSGFTIFFKAAIWPTLTATSGLTGGQGLYFFKTSGCWYFLLVAARALLPRSAFGLASGDRLLLSACGGSEPDFSDRTSSPSASGFTDRLSYMIVFCLTTTFNAAPSSYSLLNLLFSSKRLYLYSYWSILFMIQAYPGLALNGTTR